jgi:GNAT superfamily N-acetyltransferase
VYFIQKIDIEKASRCLAAAFQDYPVFTYIISDSQKRKRKLNLVCKFLLNIGFLSGQLISESNKIEVVSAWYPPGFSNIPFKNIISSGIFGLFLNLGFQSFIKLLRVKMKKNKVRKQILKNKKYYFLDIIGVNPLSQSKGLATSLIKSRLEEIEHLQIPVYLETSEIKNVNYYKKFGFAVLKAYKIKQLEVFCMIRSCN